MNLTGARAFRHGRAHLFAAVLVIAALLFCLRGLAASSLSPEATFTGMLIANGGSAADSPDRVRYPVLRTSRADRDPRAIRSMLDIRQPMTFGDFVWDDAGVPAGPMWVRVDLRRQVISVFRSGNEIGTALIIYGAQNKRSPLGQFKVLAKDEAYHSATYDAGMPFAVFLTRDGVAIHASDVRSRNATHGCVGVPIAFAQRLYAAVKVGDPVDIVETAS